MPFSGTPPNETFSRTTGLQSGSASWADTETAGRGIASSDHDVHDQDIADALSALLKRDGGNKPSANIDWNGKKITNLGAPTSDADAATKEYVDDTATGFDNFTVRLASTANVNLTTDVDAGSTFDGVALVEGDLILLKNQTTATQNGVYVVPAALGTASRSTSFDTWAEFVGSIINVTAGSAGAGLSFRCTVNSGGTVGSDNITYVQFGTTLATPVSLANGGTGEITAAAAFASLKQAATETATGVVELATTAEVVTGTDTSRAVTPAGVAAALAAVGASSLAEVALSDGSTITVNFSGGTNFGVTLGGNRTLAASNTSSNVGKKGRIRFTQDGTGSRTLTTTGSPWVNINGTEIVLSTTAGTIDYVFYEVLTSTTVLLSLARAVS